MLPVQDSQYQSHNGKSSLRRLSLIELFINTIRSRRPEGWLTHSRKHCTNRFLKVFKQQRAVVVIPDNPAQHIPSDLEKLDIINSPIPNSSLDLTLRVGKTDPGFCFSIKDMYKNMSSVKWEWSITAASIEICSNRRYQKAPALQIILPFVKIWSIKMLANLSISLSSQQPSSKSICIQRAIGMH